MNFASVSGLKSSCSTTFNSSSNSLSCYEY
jgi:hypothetical protein